MSEQEAQALAALDRAAAAVRQARRHAVRYHQLAAERDVRLQEAVRLLRDGGHHDPADAVCHELIGRGAAGDPARFAASDEDDAFARTLTSLQERLRGRIASHAAR